jgi:hypothetical protein
MALAEEAQLGNMPDMPMSITTQASAPWVDAEEADIPERSAPPQPWAPRTAPVIPEPVHH